MNAKAVAMYLGFGREYWECARYAIRSLRKQHPSLRVVLHVLPAEAKLNHGFGNLRIATHAPPPPGKTLFQHSIEARFRILAKTTERYVWFSDADSVVVRPIDIGFNLLERGVQLAMAPARGSPFGRVGIELQMKYPEIPKSMTIFAMGCIFQHPTLKVRNLWKRALAHFVRKPLLAQPALAKALLERDAIRPHVLLTREWILAFGPIDPWTGWNTNRSRVQQFFGTGKLAQMRRALG